MGNDVTYYFRQDVSRVSMRRMQSAILFEQLRPSVCLSSAGMVSKRMEMIVKLFCSSFSSPIAGRNKILKGTALAEALNT